MERRVVDPIEDEAMLKHLLSGDVLIQDGDELSLSDSFANSVYGLHVSLGKDATGIRPLVEDIVENDELVDAAEKIGERDSMPIALFVALRERLDVAETNCVQLLPILDQFLRGPPESAGTPDPFVPVRGDLLHLLIPVLQRGVVYFWRYECNPCDLVKEDFEAYFETTPEDMALLSVYGPEWGEYSREYEVVVAPTILFLRDGRIDTRLVGAFPPKALETEIENIRKLS